MKTAHLFSFFSLSLIALIPTEASSFFSKKTPEMPNIPPKPQDPECVSPLHSAHIGIRHNEMRGIGYKQGYTTIEGFAIFDQLGSYFMPFFDLRGHIFNNGRLAGNAGIGGRSLIHSISHFFGAYVYYDVRNDKHDITVQQISPGLELLGERMEYRINGYFPVAGRNSHEYGFRFDKFKGHNIILKSKHKRALTAVDAEIGAHLTQSSTYDVFAGIGPYYLTDDRTSWGGKVRLLGRFKDYFSIEFDYSYDHLFRSIFQGNIAFTYPFGQKLKRKGSGCPKGSDLLLARAAFAPSRMEIPVLKNIHKKHVAINPATSDPWYVLFVDNTSHSAGTFESPFPTLLLAQNASSPNDIIYVFPGDGTTTGMDQGITLQANQKLFGSGVPHSLSTTLGTMKIPQMSKTFPTLTNTDMAAFASVVQATDGCEISGLNLFTMANFQFAISTLTGTNGLTVTNNNFTTGIGCIGVSYKGYDEVIIQNNNFTCTDPAGIATAISLTADAGQTLTGIASNNNMTGHDIGISIVVSGTSTTSYTISDNTFTDFVAQAISFGFGGTNIYGNISNNTFSSVNPTTLALTIGFSINDTTAHFIVQNNQVNLPNSVNSGMLFSNGGNSQTNYCYQVYNNTIVAPANGIQIQTSGGTTPNVCLELSGNTSASGYTIANNGGTISLLSPAKQNSGSIDITTGPVLIVPETCCD